MLCWLKLVTIGIFVIISDVQASRILFLVPVSSKSHNNFYLPIAEELAERGHEVTFASAYALKAEKTNMVMIPNRPIHDCGTPQIMNTTLSSMIDWISCIPKFCLDGLATKEAQDLLQEKWDVVLISVFFNDCFLYDVNRMQVPFIWMIPNGLFPPFSHLAGNPTFPSFIGNPTNPVVSGPPPYTFLQRTMNILHEIFGVTLYNHYYLPRLDSLCHSRGQCTEEDPSIRDIRMNSSLFIINSIRATESVAAPYTPNVVHAGGVHLKAAKALPQDLEEWVSGSGEAGFIFFSLGSVLKTDDMPQHLFGLLVTVFSKLPYRVLWKWDADPPADLPSNIRMGKWLPQQDILGHPKIRLFITHGGLHSTQEAAHHGVPIIGIPAFGDQKSNMIQIQGNGYGRVILWEELTEDLLLTRIDETIRDEKMKSAIAKRAELMHDLPISSKDTAAYWVEYVIRHDGAPHLRCPALRMPWYRLYNMDVWATLLFIVLLSLFLTYKTIRACCKCVFRSKKIKSE
ncbi:unnamed protein product [Meganyctiphanes norvegica]|uniref:UDP-glucuronosyltransferase n=1 Tax=Meganyctiphanes norvegica TaxID=48144 RepID=A0AAV2PH74_MEGNR